MTTFPERLKTLHSRAPDRVALTLQFSNTDDLSLTVDQLLRGASSYASALTRAKIQPGEVVVLILQHGEDLVYAFWGTILRGAIPSIMPFLTEKLASSKRDRTAMPYSPPSKGMNAPKADHMPSCCASVAA